MGSALGKGTIADWLGHSSVKVPRNEIHSRIVLTGLTTHPLRELRPFFVKCNQRAQENAKMPASCVRFSVGQWHRLIEDVEQRIFPIVRSAKPVQQVEIPVQLRRRELLGGRPEGVPSVRVEALDQRPGQLDRIQFLNHLFDVRGWVVHFFVRLDGCFPTEPNLSQMNS